MIWSYIKKKLGLNKLCQDCYLMDDRIEELQTNMQEVISLLKIVHNEIDHVQKNLDKFEIDFDMWRSEVRKIDQDIENRIRTIPKQMVIKNILDVC